jgi:uncharacterized protein YdaU (DUF1376 family)
MSKDAYYFSHDSNAQHDPKILRMMKKRGWEAYGLYWGIVEKLREEDTHSLPTDYETLAFAMRIKSELIKDIVESYDLFVVEDGLFYNLRLNKSMQLVREKSQKAKESARKRWDNDANAMQTQCKERKGKEKKGKERKRKDKISEEYCPIIESNDFEFFWDLYGKKVSRGKCVKKWDKIKSSDKEKIFETLPAYVKSTPNKSYRLHPSTYLNNDGWKDAIIERKSKVMTNVERIMAVELP